MNITNLRIGARLGLGFGLVLTLLAGVAGLGSFGLSHVNASLHQVVDVDDYEVGLLVEMSENIHVISRVMRNIVLIEDDSAMQKEMTIIVEARKAYDKAEETLTSLTADDAGKALLEKIKKEHSLSRPLNDEVMALGLVNRNAEATQLLMAKAGPATAKWQAVLKEFISLHKVRDKADVLEASAAYQRSLALILSLSAVALLAGTAIAWYLTRSITAPMRRAVQVARTVAAGDLSSHIDVTTRDETGQLLQALKDMNDSLVKIVGEVRNGTDTIATASSQIAVGNQDLSSRTEQQAGSLEETASSMEQMNSTVRQNADNARQANSLAVSASEVAVKGGAMVGQVVETMASINASSKKIADIISVIDGIAFQTNILALNAAVEAARAGEQGRGFAVVASEVRNLAQRSAQAAKEIKHLIDDSVLKVGAGTQLVDQAGATMNDIVASVRRVSDVISEITAASAEQTAGIEQINEAITQMDQSTQQNAALVEEAAAAAESLQDQASNLARVVSVFRLAAHTQGSPAALPAAPQRAHRVAVLARKKLA